MGVIFSFVMGLAVMILGLMPGACTEGLSLVWGSLLAVDSLDLRLMACTAAGLLLFVFLFSKEIQVIIGQRRSAEAGIPVRQIYYACLMPMGLTVAFSLKSIGGFLIFSLCVTVRLIVDKEGMPTQCAVQSAQPAGVFEKSAMKAAGAMRFTPGRSKGRAVRTLVLLPFDYRLR